MKLATRPQDLLKGTDGGPLYGGSPYSGLSTGLVGQDMNLSASWSAFVQSILAISWSSCSSDGAPPLLFTEAEGGGSAATSIGMVVSDSVVSFVSCSGAGDSVDGPAPP